MTENQKWIRVDRLVPEVPERGTKMKLILDSDVGNEIDDLYAIGLVVSSPERFDLLGICGAHYNNSRPGAGPESIETSVRMAKRTLEAAGIENKIPVLKGSPPMQYYGVPVRSEGVDFIIAEAQKASEEEPIWIVILGAATTAASALLLEPTIANRVRYVFHSRCDYTWPTRTVQFNVKGDVHAARSILRSRVPLVWFDTGTQLTIPYSMTKEFLRPINSLGRFLHDFRDETEWFAADEKGFFDMGDIVFLMNPDYCESEIVKAPVMDAHMYFDFTKANGKMLRVYDIDNDASWNLLFESLKRS